MELHQLRAKISSGGVDVAQVFELLLKSQQQFVASRQQLAQALTRIGELEQRMGGPPTQKLDEAFSVQAEMRRQAESGPVGRPAVGFMPAGVDTGMRKTGRTCRRLSAADQRTDGVDDRSGTVPLCDSGWMEEGKSCFSRLLKKLKLAVPTRGSPEEGGLLNRLIPDQPA